MSSAPSFCRRATCGLLAAALFAAAPAHAEDVDFTILLVSDIYEIDAGDSGGFARIAAVARDERARNPNLIYIHAGDTISPSLLSNFDKGAHVIEMLNIEPLDIFVPGNHEFDFGPEVFRQRMSEFSSDTRLLAANLRDESGNKIRGFEDALLTKIEDLTIGFVGLTAGDAAVKSSPGNLKITPELDIVPAMSDQLRELGADIVVGITHSSRSVDHELRAKSGFDIMLTGDDHDLYLNYDGDTVVAEAREEGEYVVAIDVRASISERDGRRRVRWHPSFRIIDTAGMLPEAEAQDRADELIAQLDREIEVEIGSTSVELDTRRPTVRGKEAALANLIADAMREAVGADVALTNGGGIRGDKIYEAGSSLSRKDVLTELPFGNSTMLLEVTGAMILDALENGFSKIEDGAGRFPHVSGMQVAYDPSRPAGERVLAVKVAGSDLQPRKTYTLATNDYMAGGGDGYGMLPSAKRLLATTDADLMANQVINYIEAHGSIAPRVEGRLQAQ